MIVKIDPKRIRMDCETQSRVEMNEDIIAEYATAMERGDEFPPILVFFEEKEGVFILADGFHRLHAHLRARPNDQITAEQQIGTVDDAIWASLGANKFHGLRRTTADKRNATRRALRHPQGYGLSNRQLAKHVGVDDKTVADVRHELELCAEIPHMETRTAVRGRQTYQHKVVVSEADAPKSCGLCLNYEGEEHRCMIDHSVKTPWTPVCDEFEEAPENLPPEPGEAPPESYKAVDPDGRKRKKRTRNVYHYKPRDTVPVDVPINDPKLAVIELRHALGEDYLRHCFVAWQTLDEDD